jgi:hypothetical protein
MKKRSPLTIKIRLVPQHNCSDPSISPAMLRCLRGEFHAHESCFFVEERRPWVLVQLLQTWFLLYYYYCLVLQSLPKLTATTTAGVNTILSIHQRPESQTLHTSRSNRWNHRDHPHFCTSAPSCLRTSITNLSRALDCTKA